MQGIVISGSGEGTKYTTLSWVKAQITKKLGFTPYPGTLNIKLTKDSLKNKKILQKAKGLEISPKEGFCSGKCFHAFIGDFKCAIIVPDVNDYPEDTIEIIASVNSREKLKLEDGDLVKLQVLL